MQPIPEHIRTAAAIYYLATASLDVKASYGSASMAYLNNYLTEALKAGARKHCLDTLADNDVPGWDYPNDPMTADELAIFGQWSDALRRDYAGEAAACVAWLTSAHAPTRRAA